MNRILIANRTWGNLHFPEWIPGDVKNHVTSFWSETIGRGPAAWLDSAKRSKAPLIGTWMRLENLDGQVIEGRFVFMWNNICRIIMKDGRVQYAGFHLGMYEILKGDKYVQPIAGDFITDDQWELKFEE